MNQKAQVNLEFLAAALVYLLALGAVMTVGSGTLPDISDTTQRSSLNLEARQITTQMLTTSGYHQHGGGGSDWHTSDDTINSITAFGLAENGPSGPRFMELDRDRIERLKTFDHLVSGEYFNYSQFKTVTKASNQFRFNFTWMPIVDTQDSFLKGNPPSSPPITEPSSPYYSSSGNTVHYGEETLNGSIYRFLVVSHDGLYDAAYVSSNWDFTTGIVANQGEQFNLYGDQAGYRLASFQNRNKERGAMVILSQNWKTFGPRVDSDSTVIRFQRYAALEDEPMRIEVLSW